MKEMIVKIPDESSELITQLLEKLGVEVTEKKITAKKSKPAKKPMRAKKKKMSRKIDHTYLFGKWKDFDIDPKKLREEAW